MRLSLKDTNIFPMPKNPQMLHLASVGYGLREFVAMLCVYDANATCIEDDKAGNLYIEELVTTSVDFTKDVYGHFKFIEEDHLVEDIVDFLNERDILAQEKIVQILQERRRFGWLTADHIPVKNAY